MSDQDVRGETKMEVQLEEREFSVTIDEKPVGVQPWFFEDMDFYSLDEAEAVKTLQVGQSCTYDFVTTTRVK